MKHSIARWMAMALVLPLALAACESGDDALGLQDGEARLSVYLTDAPAGDVANVWVIVEEITLMGDEGPIVLLNEPTDLINLTELVGVATPLVVDATIPEGAYGQLRFRIENAVLETEAGEVYVLGGAEHPDGLDATGTLLCPSCSQSGLKVALHGMEITEGDGDLVLDFDVSQSFGHQAGKSGKWVMRPVIHSSYYPDDDMGEDGVSIEGQVVLADGVEIPACPEGTPRDLTAFVPWATAATLTDDEGAAVVRTGSVDEDGEFEINFLAPDTYTLGYAGSIEFVDYALVFTATVDPAEAVVADEDVEGVLYTVTAASCEAISSGS